MKADLVIGVDCSTTSCKAVVWDPDGKRVAESRSPLSVSTPEPLWHEQSAQTWWLATVAALRGVLCQISPTRLAAVCLSHQRETFVPVDEKGTPLRNAILWMDERAGEQLSDLVESIGSTRFHQLTGKPLSGNLSIAKIAWLRQHEPELYKQISKFLDVHAFLVYHLTCEYHTGWGSADPMGLFDMPKGEWASDLLHYLDLEPNHLPEAFPPGQVIGEVTDDASRECGLPAGLPVVVGIGDGQAAGLGARVIQPGSAYLSLGTSVVSGSFSSTYQISEEFRTMFGGVANTFLVETVILGGAYTISWLLEKVLQEPAGSEDILEREARQVPAGAQGLVLVPYWNSAMNPYWDEKASGTIIGLRGIHGRGHIYRAILEGIALEQRLHTSGVEGILGSKIDNFVVVGGGANSDLWCQIIADVTGKPVRRTLEKEAAALGAGILAASGVGIYPDPREAAQAMVHLGENIFEPDEKRYRLYSDLYEDVYRQLYPALKESFAKLVDN